METDYEMMYLEYKIKQYKDWLDQLRYYQVFVLPFINQKLGVKIGKRKVSDLRRDDTPNKSSHTT